MQFSRTAVVATISAILLAAPGAASAAVNADTIPPTTPGNLRITGSTATSVSLAWNASTDNSGVFTYVLADNFGGINSLPQWATAAQKSGLMPQRTYTYTVQAVDGSGNRSALSNSVSYTTPPDTTPPSPSTLTVHYVLPTRISTYWTVSTDNTSLLVFYTLLVNGAPRTGDKTGFRQQVLLNLAPSTTYPMVVRTADPYGNVNFGNTVTVTTPASTDITPPTAPGNLRGRDDGGCEVVLSWDRSTDNVDPQHVILYRFRVNGVLQGTQSMVIGGGTTGGASVVEGNQPGANTFTVEAVDGSGNVSAQSNPLTLNVTGC